ncbi:MAG: glycoside hydrolase family 3 protein [Chloroflexota bacterium]
MTGTSAPRPGIEALVGQRLLRSFVGHAPTPAILDAVAGRRTSGVTLFRALNIASMAEVRALTASLQAARPPGDPPLVVALDQEGGQFQALGDEATQFPGNLALAATRSTELARRFGAAIGRELAAVGVNVCFAPVCEVLDDPLNPSTGARTFGDDVELAADLVAAVVDGLQSVGVAATLKHFPGHGAVAVDSHVGMPTLEADAESIRRRELVPFARGTGAGARLVMLGHLAVPALTDGTAIAAPLSRAIATNLLRRELGFGGVAVTDALNMAGIGALEALPELAVAACDAGVDLLLTVHEEGLEERALAALVDAAAEGRLDIGACDVAGDRIRRLRGWLGEGDQPPLTVIRSDEHLALAAEIAARSVTLVRDEAGLLPLDPSPYRTILAVMPQPVDLTPADTSSMAEPGLASALRRRFAAVDEIVTAWPPTPADIAAVRDAVVGVDAVVVGTFGAIHEPTPSPQVSLVEAALASGTPTAVVSLRTPADLALVPGAPTMLCTYGIVDSSLDALADVLAGAAPALGLLPVGIPGVTA